MKKRVLASFLTAVMVMGMVGCGSADESQGDAKADGEKGGYKIGLTNSFNGNSYRQQMEAYAQEAADELTETGEISEFVIVEANNDASKQVQQIENFI